MHAPFRFIDAVGGDMLGHIFPPGDAVAIPSQHTLANQAGTDSTDRLGCAHLDDAGSTGTSTGTIVGAALVRLLDDSGGHPAASEVISVGRYVLPDGSASRHPVGRRRRSSAASTPCSPPAPAVRTSPCGWRQRQAPAAQAGWCGPQRGGRCRAARRRPRTPTPGAGSTPAGCVTGSTSIPTSLTLPGQRRCDRRWPHLPH